MDSLLTPIIFPGQADHRRGESTWARARNCSCDALSAGEGCVLLHGMGNSGDLVKAITKKGKKKIADPMTFSLLHATDFAHRLVHNILPPLKAGWWCWADRYAYTAFARDVVRVAIRMGPGVYHSRRGGRAFLFPRPSTQASRALLWPRQLKEYEKRGMDLNLAPDLVSIFKLFQQNPGEYAKIADEYGLTEIDATQSIGRAAAEGCGD